MHGELSQNRYFPTTGVLFDFTVSRDVSCLLATNTYTLGATTYTTTNVCTMSFCSNLTCLCSIVYIIASFDILPCSETIGVGADSDRFYTFSFSLSSVIERHSTLHHTHDDDSQLQNSATPSRQLQNSATPSRLPDLIASTRLCIDDI